MCTWGHESARSGRTRARVQYCWLQTRNTQKKHKTLNKGRRNWYPSPRITGSWTVQSVQWLATGWICEVSWFDYRQGQDISFFCKVSRPGLRPTKPPILFPGGKVFEVQKSPLTHSSTKSENMWYYRRNSPLAMCLDDMHRNDFGFDWFLFLVCNRNKSIRAATGYSEKELPILRHRKPLWRSEPVRPYGTHYHNSLSKELTEKNRKYTLMGMKTVCRKSSEWDQQIHAQEDKESHCSGIYCYHITE
jgi:hypothetical protein